MKKCPYCAEEIQDDAIKCKHCQSILHAAPSNNTLLSQLLPYSKWLLIGIFPLSIIAFFSPNFGINLPIVGKINISMYDVVKTTISSKTHQTPESTIKKKPEIRDIIKSRTDFEKLGENKTDIIAFLFFLFALSGLLLHYFLTIIWGICTFALNETSRLLNIVWLTLAVQYPILFSIGENIFMSDMKSKMVSEMGDDNPFAMFGAAMVGSFSIEPSLIMWILMILSTVGLIIEFMDRRMIDVSTVNSGVRETEQIEKTNTSIHKKQWLTLVVVVGMIIFMMVVLKTFILIDSGPNAKLTKDKQVEAPAAIMPPVPEEAPKARVANESNTGVKTNTYNKKTSPPSYLIRAGLSVGPISIGMTRNEVLTILGASDFPSEDREAFSDFVIQYDKDRVSEIMVTSPKYRTEEGISIKTTDRQFLALFPEAKHTCSTSSGSKVSSTDSIYDAVNKGIAHNQTLVEGARREYIYNITIHRVGVPVTIFGEIISCTSK